MIDHFSKYQKSILCIENTGGNNMHCTGESTHKLRSQVKTKAKGCDIPQRQKTFNIFVNVTLYRISRMNTEGLC